MPADPAEVRVHLVAAAKAGLALTYGELLEHLGHRFSRPKMRQLCKILAAIDEEGAARGEPELAVLVVRQSDGIPGRAGGSAAEPARAAMKDRGRGRRRSASSPPSRRKPSPSGSPATGHRRSATPVNHDWGCLNHVRSPIGGCDAS